MNCECGHSVSKHNSTATWAPLGCYAIVCQRYEGDTTGRVCNCIAFTQTDSASAFEERFDGIR